MNICENGVLVPLSVIYLLIYDDLDKIDQMWLSKYMWLCSGPSQNVTGGQYLVTRKVTTICYLYYSFYHREINNMSHWFHEYKELVGFVI